MINPLDDSWQYGLTDLTGQDPTYAAHYGSDLSGQDPTYGVHYGTDLAQSGHLDPLSSSVNPTDPMHGSLHLDHWQPHSWDYTTSSLHSAPHTVSQMDLVDQSLDLLSTQSLTDHSRSNLYGSYTDPMSSGSSTQALTDSSQTYSMASAQHHVLASGCQVTTFYGSDNVYLGSDRVGTYNGNSFYWRNGNLAGTWNYCNHHAYGPNGQDLGYAGSWNAAALMIYHQTR